MIQTDEDKPDTATPERLAKAGADTEDFITATGRRTKRLLDGSVLDMLASRRSITGDQYAAGARLYSDWYHAGLASSGVIDPSKVVVDGGKPPGVDERMLDAAGSFAKALIGVGKIHSHVLVNILLLEEPMVQYGWRRHGYKSDDYAKLAAIVDLRSALAALDLHYYGLKRPKGGRSHAADYRPVIPNAS